MTICDGDWLLPASPNNFLQHYLELALCVGSLCVQRETGGVRDASMPCFLSFLNGCTILMLEAQTVHERREMHRRIVGSQLDVKLTMVRLQEIDVDAAVASIDVRSLYAGVLKEHCPKIRYDCPCVSVSAHEGHFFKLLLHIDWLHCNECFCLQHS